MNKPVIKVYKTDADIGHPTRPCQAFTLAGVLVGNYPSITKAGNDLIGTTGGIACVKAALDRVKKNGKPRTVKTRLGKLYFKSLKEYEIKVANRSSQTGHMGIRSPKTGAFMPTHAPIHENFK